MDGTFVKQLADLLARPDVGGDLVMLPQGWVAHDRAALVKPGPAAETLDVYSLGALVEYVKANRDGLVLEKCVFHVVSPQIVTLRGPLDARTKHRETLLRANAPNLTDNFLGKYMPHEEFIIGLLTRFVDTPTRADILKLIGNIKNERVSTSSDDGVTQTVSAKQGVVLSENVPIPNPLNLVPFRTFREVPQPDSLFVLRVNGARAVHGLPEVGLFEADGGAWRLQAINSVAAHLLNRLPVEGADVKVLS